jgi:hypothetical protein
LFSEIGLVHSDAHLEAGANALSHRYKPLSSR